MKSSLGNAEAIYVEHFHLTEIDECASNPCRNNGTCNDGLGKYVCSCEAGFTGKSCEVGKQNTYPLNFKVFFFVFITETPFIFLLNT